MPDITANAPDGTKHVFPDGTDAAVVDRVMKQYITGQPGGAPSQLEQQLNKEAEPWRKVSTGAGLLSQAKDVPGAIWQGLKNIPQGLSGMADALTNPMGAAVKAAPEISEQVGKAGELWGNGGALNRVEAGGRAAGAALAPLGGMWAVQKGEQAGRGDVLPAAAEVGTTLVTGKLGSKLLPADDISAKISDAQKAIHRHLAIDKGKVSVVNENVRQPLVLLDNAVNGEIGKSVNSVLTADDADRLSSGLKGGSVDVSKAAGAARDTIGKTAKNVSNAADDQILRGESQPSMTMRDAKSYTTDVGKMAAALRRQGNFREAAVLDSLYNGLHEATQERAGQLGKVHGDLWQHYINETRNYKDMQGGLLGELVDEPNHAKALDKLVDPSKATEAKEITEALKKYGIDSTPFEKAQEMGVRLNKYSQDNKAGFIGTLKGIIANPIAVGLPVLAIKMGIHGPAGMVGGLIAATKISGILNDVELSRTLREIGETTSPESARVRPPLEGEVPKPPPPATGGPQTPKGGTPAPKGPDFSTDIQGMLKDQFKYTDNAAKGITNKIAGKYTTLDEGIKMAIAEATSRAKESKAPAADRPQAQWKGGISSAGTEQAIKKSSLADQIQALRSESEGLKEDIRAGRRPPQAEGRIRENLQLIRELEGKK